jgi:hypothetical protein
VGRYFSGENNQRNLKKKVFADVYFASFQNKISIFCLPVLHPYLYNKQGFAALAVTIHTLRIKKYKKS